MNNQEYIEYLTRKVSKYEKRISVIGDLFVHKSSKIMPYYQRIIDADPNFFCLTDKTVTNECITPGYIIEDDMKEVHRKLVLKIHPDKSGSDTEQDYIELNQAYESNDILKIISLCKKYDVEINLNDMDIIYQLEKQIILLKNKYEHYTKSIKYSLLYSDDLETITNSTINLIINYKEAMDGVNPKDKKENDLKYFLKIPDSFEHHMLDLRTLDIHDRIDQIIEKLSISHISTLYLDSCGLNDEELIKFINLLNNNKGIRYISFSDNNITEKTIIALADILDKNRLKSINISNNNIGDNGLKIFVDMLKKGTELVDIKMVNINCNNYDCLLEFLNINNKFKSIKVDPNIQAKVNQLLDVVIH